MLKDKIVDIVKTMTHLTETGVLKWIEENPNSVNRYFKRKMTAEGEDGSKYEMEIKFSLSGEEWKLDESPDIWIKNKSLPDGMFYITCYKSDNEVRNLRNSVLSKYCQDMDPKIDDLEETLDNIAKGISIVEYREGRLNKILN